MNFATTFQDRIYNRLAAGQTSSARSDCGHIAAEADTEIELLKEELLDVTAQRDMKQPALDQAIAQMKKQSIEIGQLRAELEEIKVDRDLWIRRADKTWNERFAVVGVMQHCYGGEEMDQVGAAAKMAGEWWAERLAEKYADKRAAFSKAVESRVLMVFRGELRWKVEIQKRPNCTVHVTVRDEPNGKPQERVYTQFDYDPDILLEEALIEAIPDLQSWDLRNTLPCKYDLTIYPNKLAPKEGYGNWTADIRVPAVGAA